MLLTDCNTFQTQWVLGKVTATYPGQDGLVRAADDAVPQAAKSLPAGTLDRASYAARLQIKTTTYRRPVVKLARLFHEEEKSPGQDVTSCPPPHPPQDVGSQPDQSVASN